jgi:very-short-patch-repair endonuclease
MVHDKIKDIECNKCDYKCSLNGDLQRHIKAVHDKIKDIECDKCDYKCSRTGNLREHIKIVHDKIKDFECKLCEYKCSTKYGLKRHIKICTGVDNCSAGEYKIKQALNEMRINYEFDSSHEVKSDKGYLRWDFIIQSDEPLFIEYDGRQHFGPVRFGSMSIEKAQKAFQKQKKYDKLKDDYCSDNGYLLLRIPYTEYGNINKLVGDFIIQNTDWGFE